MAEEKIILEQLEEDWKYLALTGAGVALSDRIVGYIRGFLPVQVASPLLKIGVGWVMRKFLAPRFAPEFLTPFSDGVMIAGTAELINQVLSGALGALLAPPTQTQTQAQPTAERVGVIVV